MSQYAILVGKIQKNLSDLENLTVANQGLMEKIRVTGDADYYGTVALNLHSFDSGVERIFREVALDVEGSLPEAADWHRRLLRQMTVEVPDVRPAMLSDATVKCLNEFCSFRHVVRNVYSFDLLPDRIEVLSNSLPRCFKQLQQDLKDFCEFLMDVNSA